MALRLNLGSGNNHIPGFVSVDKFDKEADVMADICYLPYEDNTVEEIVAYQVIEHLPYWQTSLLVNSIGEQYEPTFFQECYRVLKKGGKMITECPDILAMAQKLIDSAGDVTYEVMVNLYGEYYRPWDKNRYDDWEHQAGSLHINGFTFKRIQAIADYVGFRVREQTMAEKHKDYKYEANLSVEWIKI